MGILFHLLSTILIFLIINLIYPLHYLTLIIALILTLMIDIVEHGTIIFKSTPGAIKIRKMVFKGQIFKAYYFYYSQKQNHNGLTLFHNLLFFIIITLISSIILNFSILIGISFHLLFDMISDKVKFKKLHNCWYLKKI